MGPFLDSQRPGGADYESLRHRLLSRGAGPWKTRSGLSGLEHWVSEQIRALAHGSEAAIPTRTAQIQSLGRQEPRLAGRIRGGLGEEENEARKSGAGKGGNTWEACVSVP